jgi:hypothetical protein
MTVLASWRRWRLRYGGAGLIQIFGQLGPGPAVSRFFVTLSSTMLAYKQLYNYIARCLGTPRCGACAGGRVARQLVHCFYAYAYPRADWHVGTVLAMQVTSRCRLFNVAAQPVSSGKQREFFDLSGSSTVSAYILFAITKERVLFRALPRFKHQRDWCFFREKPPAAPLLVLD